MSYPSELPGSPRFSRSLRIAGIARLIPHLGQLEGRSEAAERICVGVRELLGSSAAALFLDEGVFSRAAVSGFALDPPAHLPASLAIAELEKLRTWGEQNGHGPVEIAPLFHQDQQMGALVLFGGSVEALAGDELKLLGEVVECALEQARTLDEMRRAYETQERTQAQVVRSERLRVLGEMALGIAHDFNNVLNAVLGQVGVIEVLSSRLGDVAAPLERLKHVAVEGARTVRRLQDFSRQRRDREFAEVDLAELLRGVSATVRDRQLADLIVEEHLPPRLVMSGNEVELREAVLAVLDNAAEAKSHRITVELTVEDDDARVVIADDGLGMSKHVRKRAFDPFFTSNGPLASGLGLSVAYGIVRRHGGRIDLDSTPGHGTRVRMRLPMTRAATEPPSRSPSATAAPSERTGMRILLVEDDDDNREAMSTLLSLAGHRVTAAATGDAGVREFGTDHFDLVLTDLGLPDMSGWEVARQIKELGPAVPVALITGWGLNLAQDEIRRRGVDVLIKKPIEPRRFLDQLSGVTKAAAND